MTYAYRAFTAAAFALILTACETTSEKNFFPSSAPLPIATSDQQAWEKLSELPWPQDGQHRYQNFEEAKRAFWKKLYPNGGTELYCGVEFDGSRQDSVNELLSVEHAYPADSIAETDPSCTNRSCSATRVQRAMADLQNLWPAFQRVNSSRSKLRYGQVPDTTPRRFADFCPSFKRGSGTMAVVEPRDEVKGDLARSVVYMHFVYGLPLENAVNDQHLLLTWMRLDPPDTEELRRNAGIAQLQGTSNPLLTDAFISFNEIGPYTSAMLLPLTQ